MKASANSFPVNRAFIFVLLTVGACLYGGQLAKAQFFVVDFRFDPSDPGYNPAAPSVLSLAPGQAGATYKVDIYGTAVAASPRAIGTDFQLQAVSLRGLDDGGNAFSTGAGLGVVAGSFAPNSPTFLTTGFVQPGVSDLGRTTNSGVSATAGADGLLDFGGTVIPQLLTFFAFPTAPGNGSNVSSYTWLLGSFDYTIGQANSFSSTTRFWPTLLASGQGPATAAEYTTTGGTISAGPVTLSTSPLTFTVAGPPAETISVTPAAASASVLKGGSITLNAALNNTGSIDLNGGDYTFTASGGSTIVYGPASPTAATTPIGAGLSQSFTFNASTAPGPAGTPIGLATVTFTAADSGGGKITNSPQTGAMQVNVGGAVADNSNKPGVYGAASQPSSDRAGAMPGWNPPSSASKAQGAATRPSCRLPHPGRVATPRFWREQRAPLCRRLASVCRGGLVWLTPGPTDCSTRPTAAPDQRLQTINTSTGLISDVVNLSGLETSSPSTNSTDPYVFDLTYNTSMLLGHEQGLTQNKLLFMVSPLAGADGGKSQYVNTVQLNSGNVVTNPLDLNYGAVSSWNAYALTKFGTTTPTATQLSSDMGAWGVDTSAS